MKRICLAIFLLSFPFFLFSQSSMEELGDREVMVVPQQAQGSSAQAALEDEDFPFEAEPIVATPVPTPEDSTNYSYRPPFNPGEIALHTLAGTGIGLAAGLVLAVLFVTLALGAGLIGWELVAIGFLGASLGFFIGVPLGVWIIGNNSYRRGNLLAVFGMSLVGWIVGGLISIIPFFVLLGIFFPALGAALGFWLSSRFTEAPQPMEEEYYEDEYYEYLHPGGLGGGSISLSDRILRRFTRKKGKPGFLRRLFGK